MGVLRWFLLPRILVARLTHFNQLWGRGGQYNNRTFPRTDHLVATLVSLNVYIFDPCICPRYHSRRNFRTLNITAFPYFVHIVTPLAYHRFGHFVS